MVNIAVIGAGGWGTTLANLLVNNDNSVKIWAYEQETVESINENHENSQFLIILFLQDTISVIFYYLSLNNTIFIGHYRRNFRAITSSKYIERKEKSR